MNNSLNILKLLPFFIVTAMLINMIIEPFIIIAFAILWFISLPIIALSIFIFFKNIRCRNVWQRTTTIWGIVNIVLLTFALIIDARSDCNPDIMAKHYDEYQTNMKDLHSYMKNAIDDSCAVELEFKYKVLKTIRVKYNTQDGDKETYTTTNKKNLMAAIGLTSEECNTIRKKLKQMECIGIEYSQYTPEEIQINFRRVGMGRYSYNIYSRPLTEEEKCNAIEDYALIPYNEHCIFEYGGGAIGPQTFTNEVKYNFMKNHQPWSNDTTTL